MHLKYHLWNGVDFVRGRWVNGPTHYYQIIKHISYYCITQHSSIMVTQMAKFLGPTWGPPGSYRPQMGPMLAPGTLLSGHLHYRLRQTLAICSTYLLQDKIEANLQTIILSAILSIVLERQSLHWNRALLLTGTKPSTHTLWITSIQAQQSLSMELVYFFYFCPPTLRKLPTTLKWTSSVIHLHSKQALFISMVT